MAKMLSIEKKAVFDESIAHYDVHAHQPYAQSTFNRNDEIRISVQNQDSYVLPSRSSLHLMGKLKQPNGAVIARTDFITNALCHLFEEMRYELNGIEIERIRNVGITTAIKAYVSQTPNQAARFGNAGWYINDLFSPHDAAAQGRFDLTIPLSFLFGFAEDYPRVVVNAKHELVLLRANTDTNAILQIAPVAPAVAEEYEIEFTKIEWMMPYVKVSDQEKIRMLNYIATDPSITMSFRTWELYEYPLLPETTKHTWNVKTTNQLEKPRYVILGFQTNRKNNATSNASRFDNCGIENVKLYLNSQSYPYSNLGIKFSQHHISRLYEMYANFQSSYYNKENEPVLNYKEFRNDAPLFVIDCSKQNDALVSGPVDVTLEIESGEALPARTAAFCLIIHDRIVEYQPLSGIVKKL